MDHRRIEEMNIPDLYATGRLSTTDEEAFETHLLECRECREQVAWADDFGASMRTVAVEEVARAATSTGFLVWLARRAHVVRLGLTAALLVLAALPAWLLVERSSLRSELADARAAAERPAPTAPTAPTAPRTAPVPQGPDAATKAELERLTRERSRLQEELSREREAREALANRMASLTQPQVNTAVVSLGVVRGASDAGEVELGSAPEWIVLSLELPAAEYDTYRAALFDTRGRRVWRGDGLLPTASDTLNVLVHSDLLKPGEYRLSLEGVDGDSAVPAGEIPFRVRRD
jgi:hypothetical protein